MRMHQGLSSAAAYGRLTMQVLEEVSKENESSVHEVTFSQSHVTASRHVTTVAWHLQSEILLHLPLKCRRSDMPNLTSKGMKPQDTAR